MIDGLNLIRSLNGPVNFEAFLTVIIDVASRAADFGCIFDANTVYVLRDARCFAQLEACRRLLGTFGDFFTEVTGGTQADDLILAEADAINAIVISNDRFRHSWERYQWIQNPQANRICRVNRFRNHLHFNGRRLHLEDDLQMLMRKLLKELAERRKRL